jgi:hypothetical protein
MLPKSSSWLRVLRLLLQRSALSTSILRKQIFSEQTSDPHPLCRPVSLPGGVEIEGRRQELTGRPGQNAEGAKLGGTSDRTIIAVLGQIEATVLARIAWSFHDHLCGAARVHLWSA